MERGPHNEQKIVNIYCSECFIASYNLLKVSVTKNKKLENYYCSKCNSNDNIIIMMFSYPDGCETSETILYGKDHDVSITMKIDEMYKLGLNSPNKKWLKYKSEG